MKIKPTPISPNLKIQSDNNATTPKTFDASVSPTSPDSHHTINDTITNITNDLKANRITTTEAMAQMQQIALDTIIPAHLSEQEKHSIAEQIQWLSQDDPALNQLEEQIKTLTTQDE